MLPGKPRTELVFRLLLSVVLLLGSVGTSRPVLAAPPSQEGTPTQTVTETPTVEPTVPPSETAAPTVTETRTGDPTLSPTETTSTQATSTANSTVTPAITETPAPTNTSSSVAQEPVLTLFSNPNFITPGGNLILTWEVQGVEPKDMTLQIHLPEGFAPLGKFEGTYDEPNRTLLVPLSSLSVQVHLTTSVTDQDVLFEATLLKNGESLANASLFVPAHETFVMDKQGGEIVAKNGKVKIRFPQDAVQEKTIIQVGTPVGDHTPANQLAGEPFEITAYTALGSNELHEFNAEIEIEVDFTELGIPQERVENLYLHWYNPETGDWIALPSSVDLNRGTVTGITTHFTVFGVGVETWQSAMTPTIDDFQVATFTGAASYSFPIKVPAGAGGLQPDLALTYNSQVVDQATTETQASWVGMGWSLETGSIVADTADTTFTTDDTFYLNVGGVSTRLVYDGSAYHAANENFWKFSYNSTTKQWTVWDKVGNIYSFEEYSTLAYTGDCDNNNPDSGGERNIIYQWELTKVKNIHGKVIQYTYEKESKPIYVETYSNYRGGCTFGTSPSYTAVYPKTIVYPNQRYRIYFERESRSDYKYSLLTDAVHHMFQQSRLKNIHIQYDPAGTGFVEPAGQTPDSSQTIRRYQLTYEDDATKVIFPGFTYSAGGHVSTLSKIQEFGFEGVDYLPAYTFTYGDNLHLTRAENGYGGVVEFDYDDQPGVTDYQPWYYTGGATKYNSVWHNFGTQNNCKPAGWGPLDPSSIATVDCTGADPYLKVRGNAYNAVLLSEASLPLIRPGGKYRITASPTFSSGMSVQVGFVDGVWYDFSSPNSTSGTMMTHVVTLPHTAESLQMHIKTTGGAAGTYANFSSFKTELLPSFYRVKQKRVSDSNGNTYTYSYSYLNQQGNDSAAVNDSAHSSVCSPGQANCTSFIEAYSEFRGNGWVTETGPDGQYTITSYSQDDALKGVLGSVSIKDPTGKFVSVTTYNSSAVSLPMYIVPGYTYMGFGRYWVHPSTTFKDLYTKDGLKYSSTAVVYAYESAYGNLISQGDQYLKNGIWTSYRHTDTSYWPRNDGTVYLVSLPGRIKTFDGDGANNPIAETLYLYDTNLGDFKTAPVTGRLTAVRTWVRNSDEYQQTSYVYDSWGNRTSETTYTGYGTWNTSPTTAPLTTTTVYDPGFQTYPISSTNPLSQTTNWTYDYALGVPLTESDPNDSGTNDTTITAEYDSFGRMTKLVRPGDSITDPTLRMSYNDISQPLVSKFITTIAQKLASNKYYSVQRKYDGMGRQIQINSGGTTVDMVYPVRNSQFITGPMVTKQSVPYTGTSPNLFTTTTIDPTAHTTTIQAPDGTSTVTYTNGLVTTVTDGNQHITNTTYDEWGRVVRVEPPTGPTVSYTYDEMDRLKTVLRGGVTTTLDYDNAGRKISMTDPDMGNWTYAYDALGNLTRQTDARGQRICLYYDLLNRLIGKHYRSDDSCPATPTYNVSYSYDSGTNGKGRRTGMSIPSLSSTTWTYDLRGRMITESKTISGATPAFTTSWTYNSADLPTSMTYPGDGEIVNYEYTERMLVNKVYSSLATYVASTTYDAAGRMDVRTFGTSTAIQTDFDYYPWSQQGGRLQALKSGPTTAPTSLQNLSYTYDPVGNIQTIQNQAPSNGETQSFGYDALDRLTSANVTGSYPYTESDGYDATTGNLSAKDPTTFVQPQSPNPGTTGLAAWWSMNESSDMRRDSHGSNPLSDNNTVGSGPGIQGNAASFVTANREFLSRVDTPAISTGDIDFTFSANVYLNSTTNMMILANKGLASSSTRDFVLYYNPTGSKFVFSVGNGTVSGSASSNESVTPGQWYRVVAWHDAVNNTLNIQVNNGAAASVAYTSGSMDTTYPLTIGAHADGAGAWDGRIDEVFLYKRVLSEAERTWLYNGGQGRSYTEVLPVPSGSALLLTYAATVSGCVGGGRTIAHAVSAMGSNTYSYDCNGNQTRRISGSDTYDMSYDAENRLSQVKKNSTVIAAFTYDGDGNRVKSVMGSETTLFIGGHYEVTNPGAGQTVTKYYFAGATRVAMRKYTIPTSMAVEYFLGDHLGSTSITTDNTGAKVSEIRYKPWGEIRYAWKAGTITTPAYKLASYTFTGQFSYLDDPTTAGITEGFGLMYYNARYYSPYITQFSQPDSIVPDPYNPQDLNRYAYARYNPLRYTDPSGHRVCEEKAGVCKAYTQADQISDLKLIIKDQFKWFVKGKDWTVKELETIYQTGTDIMTYIDKETGGYGLDWMNKYLGGVNIYHVDANRDSALPGIGSTRINLFRGWLTQDGGARWFAHELGHVWDLNTGLLGYGGEADQLNAKINGNKLLGLFSCRFCDGSGLDHIPAGYAWAPGAYGNNSTADYFAEAFALMVYPSSGPQIPVGVQDWMNGQISAETAWSNFP